MFDRRIIGGKLHHVFQNRRKNRQEEKKLSRQTTYFLLAAGLLFGTGAAAFAQQFTGGIRGTVSDANGVIPGAAVTLT